MIKVKEESEKAGLKLDTQKCKFMASSPINSWQIEGEIVKAETDVLFLGSKITMDGDFAAMKSRCLLLRRKAMTNLDMNFPVAHTVKNLLAIQKTQVRSLGREDSPGEGNGCPLQYSCLENSKQATVYGVAKS